jgi:hypothetical protein
MTIVQQIALFIVLWALLYGLWQLAFGGGDPKHKDHHGSSGDPPPV